MNVTSGPYKQTMTTAKAGATQRPIWSSAGTELIRRLDLPFAARGLASYLHELVECDVPGESCLMQQDEAEELYRPRHLQEPHAGVDARKVLAQLLVDLAWNSSRLESNRYSLEVAEELRNGGTVRWDVDTVMLLNHKSAIEFLVNCVPQDGLSSLVFRNLHAILMQDLVPDSGSLGVMRNGPLGIAGTLYSPLQEPDAIEAMLQAS